MNSRLLSGYQGMDKPPRKNMPARRYGCETVDSLNPHSFGIQTGTRYCEHKKGEALIAPPGFFWKSNS